jgi:CBS domain containing-hemolysin-like protein
VNQLPGDMNVDVLLLIAYVLLALILSFLCSVAEAVLLSITPSYIEGQKERRPRYAALLKQLRQEDVGRSLAAILTLNTAAHTMGAIGAGAKAAVVFGNAWFGVFSAVMTLAILFLSEIVPKTIGAVYWVKLTGSTVMFVKGLIVLLYPLVLIAESLTKFISRGKPIDSINRDEFVAMTRVGEAAGYISKNEVRIVRNLFRLNALRAADIMTPRTVIGSLPEDMTATEASEYAERVRFSRLPIHKNGLDNITGYVLRSEILLSETKGQGDEPLKNMKQDIKFVPELAPLATLFEQFLESRHHIAIVVDEHGGTEGLVTLEDLIETLMGMEIVDETDEVVDMRSLAREKWKERAKKFAIDTEVAESRRAEQDAAADADKPRR